MSAAETSLNKKMWCFMWLV